MPRPQARHGSARPQARALERATYRPEGGGVPACPAGRPERPKGATCLARRARHALLHAAALCAAAQGSTPQWDQRRAL